MIDHLIIKLLELALKGLGPLAENFPDDPRLGRKLLLGGSLLVLTIAAPTTSPEWGDFILILKSLCIIAGGACWILGGFVFFRRWVWKREDRRVPVITSLNLK